MISKSHLGSQFGIQNELSSLHRTSSNAEECCKKAAITCMQSSLAATSNKWLRELLKQTVLLTLNIVYIVFVSIFILHISMVWFFVCFMNLSIPLLNSCNFFFPSIMAIVKAFQSLGEIHERKNHLPVFALKPLNQYLIFPSIP